MPYQRDVFGTVAVGEAPEQVPPLTGTQAAQVAPMVPGRCAHLVGRSRGPSAWRPASGCSMSSWGASRWPFSPLLWPSWRSWSDAPPGSRALRTDPGGYRPFRCLKFRTMRVGADAELTALLESDSGARTAFAASYKLSNDPRDPGWSVPAALEPGRVAPAPQRRVGDMRPRRAPTGRP